MVGLGREIQHELLASILPHMRQPYWICNNAFHLLSKVRGISRPKEQSGVAIIDNRGHRAMAGGQNGRAFGKRLCDDPWEILVALGWQHQSSSLSHRLIDCLQRFSA